MNQVFLTIKNGVEWATTDIPANYNVNKGFFWKNIRNNKWELIKAPFIWHFALFIYNI